MPSLITPEEFAEIRSVVQDVTDTFHKKSITYLLRGESLDINNEDRTDQTLTPYVIMGLVVWSTTTGEGRVEESREGNLDLTEGYVNFNYDDCDLVGLISGFRFIGMPDQDLIEFDGIRYKVIGIPPLGQFPEKNSLIKVNFRKLTRDGN